MLPTPRPSRSGDQRNRGRLTVASATSGEEERTRSVAAFRRRTQRLKGHGAQERGSVAVFRDFNRHRSTQHVTNR